MKTRPIKELLILIRDEVEVMNGRYFMCWANEHLLCKNDINASEFNVVYDYLWSNRPKHVKPKDQSMCPQGQAWWSFNDKNSRIKWLNRQIKKLS